MFSELNQTQRVIISGYDYYGKKIFSKLSGMWSVVILTRKKTN